LNGSPPFVRNARNMDMKLSNAKRKMDPWNGGQKLFNLGLE